MYCCLVKMNKHLALAVQNYKTIWRYPTKWHHNNYKYNTVQLNIYISIHMKMMPISDISRYLLIITV